MWPGRKSYWHLATGGKRNNNTNKTISIASQAEGEGALHEF